MFGVVIIYKGKRWVCLEGKMKENGFKYAVVMVYGYCEKEKRK